MLVELKNGETLNGHLANCDNWMNLVLKEVVQTSPEGDRFFKLPEVYVRGNNVRDVFESLELNLLGAIRFPLHSHLSVCLLTNRATRSNTYGSPKKSSISSRSSNRPATRVADAVAIEVMDVIGAVGVAVDAVGVEGEAAAKDENVTILPSFPFSIEEKWIMRDTPGEKETVVNEFFFARNVRLVD